MVVKVSQADEEVIQEKSLLQIGKENTITYAKAVILDRALPDYRDGFKPIHRRILWSMFDMGLKHNGPYIKSARVVGECFAADTLVSTPTGPRAIETLEIGDEVKTSCGIKKVTALFENPPAPLFLLNLLDGKSVILTENQEVKIKIGEKFYWKKACELTQNDQIVIED